MRTLQNTIMKYIDIETWARAPYFKAYQGTDFPYINIGAEMDITNLKRFTKEAGLSFYFAMVYAATAVADSIENFRYRFEGDEPFIIDRNIPVIAHLRPGEELFVIIDGGAPDRGIVEFCRRVKEKSEGYIENGGLDAFKGRMDIINYSCIPWVRYTHFVRTIARGGVDCNPKISWGQYWKEEDRVKMTLSVQVHHGLMDGWHVGKYFNRLQKYLDEEGWDSPDFEF